MLFLGKLETCFLLMDPIKWSGGLSSYLLFNHLSVCLCSAAHTDSHINGMAQCRRTQPSCKAPTPSFFSFFFFFTLVSLMPQVVAPQSPNFPFTHMRNHIPTVWHTLWQSRCHWSGQMCVTKHRRTQNNHVFLFGWEQSAQTKAVVSLLADLHKNRLLSNPLK